MGGKIRTGAFVILFLAALLLFGVIALFSPLTGRGEPARIEVEQVITLGAEKRVEAKPSFPIVQRHCPYYPPDVKDISFIFSRTTVDRFREVAKEYPKDSPIALLVVNGGGLPLLANWFCTSADHISVESVLVVVPPENGTRFVDTLSRKGITAIQTSFR